MEKKGRFTGKRKGNCIPPNCYHLLVSFFGFSCALLANISFTSQVLMFPCLVHFILFMAKFRGDFNTGSQNYVRKFLNRWVLRKLSEEMCYFLKAFNVHNFRRANIQHEEWQLSISCKKGKERSHKVRLLCFAVLKMACHPKLKSSGAKVHSLHANNEKILDKLRN